MSVIGISGKANAGKDTFADFLHAYPPWFVKKSFAFKLKQIAQILTGWPDQYTREGKAHYLPEWGMTVGTFQQKLGTDAVRFGLKDDAWILALFADYTPNQFWCIQDVRFANEAESIRERDGVLVRINRDIEDDCGRDKNHISETALDNWHDWDFVIDNNGSLEHLESEALRVLREIQW